MKKSIILSGPPGSGKTYMADVMKKLFTNDTMLTWPMSVDSNFFLDTDRCKIGLVIVDECTLADIARIHRELFAPVPEYLRDQLPSIVYMTQEKIADPGSWRNIAEVVFCKYKEPRPSGFGDLVANAIKSSPELFIDPKYEFFDVDISRAIQRIPLPLEYNPDNPISESNPNLAGLSNWHLLIFLDTILPLFYSKDPCTSEKAEYLNFLKKAYQEVIQKFDKHAVARGSVYIGKEIDETPIYHYLARHIGVDPMFQSESIESKEKLDSLRRAYQKAGHPPENQPQESSAGNAAKSSAENTGEKTDELQAIKQKVFDSLNTRGNVRLGDLIDMFSLMVGDKLEKKAEDLYTETTGKKESNHAGDAYDSLIGSIFSGMVKM